MDSQGNLAKCTSVKGRQRRLLNSQRPFMPCEQKVRMNPELIIDTLAIYKTFFILTDAVIHNTRQFPRVFLRVCLGDVVCGSERRGRAASFDCGRIPHDIQGKNLCPDLLPRLSLVMRSPTAAAGMMLHHASLTLTLHFGVFRTHRDEALMVQVGRL